jgi:hypothetical protein
MNEVDEIRKGISNTNKYLEDYVFEVYYLPDANGNLKIPTNVKVKLTGLKHYVDMGHSKPFVQFTAYILPSNSESDLFNSILTAHFGKETEIKTYDYGKYQQFGWVIQKKLSEFLKYFSLPDAILTKVVNEVKPMKLNESLITEARFDNAVRTVVKDVISFFKYQREGDFGLPEDLRPDQLTYSFPDMQTEFSVFLDLQIDENIQEIDVDADYYRDDDLIYLTIISPPIQKAGYKDLQKLTSELNEVLRHEFEHIKQLEQGYKFPKKEPADPYKYYTQPHELEAQKAGFRRRAKGEKLDFETVVRNWFEKNPHKHNLNPEQKEKVIQKIIQK